VFSKGLDRLGIRQEGNVICLVKSLRVLHTGRMHGGDEAVPKVEILLVQGDPVLHSVAESLVKRNAIVIKILDNPA
jgi:hypothetical protein